MPRSSAYVLDTNVLIHLVRGKHVARWMKHHYKLLDATSLCSISYISRAEALALAERRGWGKTNIERLGGLLDGFPEISIEQPKTLEAYLECAACLRNQKPAKKIGHHDIWIAATALVAEATLLSTDKDFNHLRDLIEFEYIDAQGVPKDWQPPAP